MAERNTTIRGRSSTCLRAIRFDGMIIMTIPDGKVL
jgi:hypothetical protein